MWISRTARFALAAVFLLAGVPKLFNPNDFAQVISMYGIVPESLVLETALVLIAAELAIALGLMLDRIWAVVAAGVMLLLFIAVLAYGIHLGLDIDCGCFGPEDPEHSAVSNLRSAVVRDILLLIPVAYLLAVSTRKTNGRIKVRGN